MARVARPFTLDHFTAWATDLVLDNGCFWKLEPFQAGFVEDVFSGVPECWLIVPEGNGKTTLVAGLALYHAQFRPGAAVAVAASSRDQARIMYRQAKGFINRTRQLGQFMAFDGLRRIDYRSHNSYIEIMAADSRTGDGIIPTMCIIDELHRHKSMELYETWSGKLDKRGAQVITISTAGEPGGDFEELRGDIRQKGEIERQETFLRSVSETVLLHEWAVPEDGDVEDIELVARANPFSGITVSSLTKKRSRPTMTLGHWRRFTCNLPTRSEYAAIQEKEWFDAQTTEEIPAGDPVWVGLDVAWKWDTTSAVPLWIRDDQFRLLGKARVLVPPRDGNSLDPNLVEAALIEIHDRNPIHTLVMDTSRAEQLATWAETELGCTVIDRQQTNVYAAQDYAKFTEALRMGWLKHPGDPELTRHVLNAVTRILPRGDARFERSAQSRNAEQQDRRVIDALIAAAMVHSEACEEPSVYAERPLVMV